VRERHVARLLWGFHSCLQLSCYAGQILLLLLLLLPPQRPPLLSLLLLLLLLLLCLQCMTALHKATRAAAHLLSR
jgi:hypothetical protein